MSTYLLRTKQGRYVSNTSKFEGISSEEIPNVNFTNKKEDAYFFRYRSDLQSYLESLARNRGIADFSDFVEIIENSDTGTETVLKTIRGNDYKLG